MSFRVALDERMNNTIMPVLTRFCNLDKTQCELWLVKNHALSEHTTKKRRVSLFFATLSLYHKANKKYLALYYTVIKNDGHLRTLETVSCEFSNARRVLYYKSNEDPMSYGLLVPQKARAKLRLVSLIQIFWRTSPTSSHGNFSLSPGEFSYMINLYRSR